MKKTLTQISEYYQRSHWLYKFFWFQNQKSQAMHFGFWDNSTKSSEQALINQYKFVIKKSQLNSSSRVLDAGCGFGGGCIYMAKATRADITGITIVPSQVRAANRLVKAEKLNNCRFLVRDFHDTKLPSGSFDLIYGIESICYAYPKEKFLKEAFRLLNSGGKLIISDGFAIRTAQNESERALINDWCDSWRLSELIQYTKFKQKLAEAGFRIKEEVDQSQKIIPDFKRMKNLINLAKPLVWLATKTPFSSLRFIADNARALADVIEGVSVGLGGYFSIVAVKSGITVKPSTAVKPRESISK